MRSRRLALSGGLLAAGVALALLAPRDLEAWLALGDGAGAWGPILFLAAWIPATCLLVPGTALCVLGAALFGPLGVGLSLVGSPLGALAAFGLARLVAPSGLVDRLPDRVRTAAQRLERGGVGSVALVRSAPGLPACAFNYACGLTALRPRAFLGGSALGAAPRIVLYGALGSAAVNGAPAVALAAGLAAIALLALLGARRRLRPA